MALRVKQSFSARKKNLSEKIPDELQFRLLKYTGIVLFVLIALLHFRAAFFLQLSENRGQHMESFSSVLTHPGALADIAREYHLRDANLASALSLYKKALENFVLHLPSWLGVTEVLSDQGKDAQAVNALTFIHNHFENNDNVTWSKALLANTLDQEQILTENLIWLARNSSGKKKDVIQLAALTWDQPSVLMNKFGKRFYGDILQEYIRKDELDNTRQVWKEMADQPDISSEIALRYINYLLGRKENSLAAEVWTKSIGSGSPLIYNGNFAKELLGTAFGWRISRPKGMTFAQLPEKNGLGIAFDGSDNFSFQLSQLLPLLPGKYIFSGSVETKGLTTDQLPFWTLQGANCIGLSEKSPMVLPDQPTTEFSMPFSVPDDCELIRLALTRRQSFHFDNKLKGMIILRNLALLPENNMSTAAQPSAPSTLGNESDVDKSLDRQKTKINVNSLNIQQQ